MRRHQAINGGIGAAVTLAMATTISIQLAALADDHGRAGGVRVRGLAPGRGQQQLPAGGGRPPGQHALLRRRLPRRRQTHRKVQQRLQRRRLGWYVLSLPLDRRRAGVVYLFLAVCTSWYARRLASTGELELTPDGHEWVQRRLWGSRGARRRTCRSRGAPADDIVSSPGASAE